MQTAVDKPPCSDMDEDDKCASGVEGNEREEASVNAVTAEKGKDDNEKSTMGWLKPGASPQTLEDGKIMPSQTHHS